MKGIFIMANKLKFTRTTVDKVQVKGVLSEDANVVVYVDDDKIEQEVRIVDLLNAFKNQAIDLSVSLKSEEDLELIESEADDE